MATSPSRNFALASTWACKLASEALSFSKGNAAGIAYGQPGNASGLSADASLMEIFYKYKVSDNISITPAIIYVANNQAFSGASSNWGGVIQTTFKF